MTNGGQRPDPSGFRIENEMDLLFGRAHPNPTREGCPPAELLMRLARRELPIGDPAYDHFAKCSPCYQELRTLQQASAAELDARKRTWWTTAAAAVVVLGIAGTWFLWSRSGDVAPKGTVSESSSTPEVTARLDLRKYSVARSEQKQAEPEPVSVPRGRLNLTMLLPVGFEAGDYDVQVLDTDLKSRASTTGRAEIRDYITTLQTNLDIISLAPGAYQLAVRRQGEDWQLFPIAVK
jgi:hypothetical protein